VVGLFLEWYSVCWFQKLDSSYIDLIFSKLRSDSAKCVPVYCVDLSSADRYDRLPFAFIRLQLIVAKVMYQSSMLFIFRPFPVRTFSQSRACEDPKGYCSRTTFFT
jgi:hypothetical protein